ncbi:uncharacterized protein LOC135844490 isoform X2 [Planococcus citri]|uniref:uncharacterized protein LOC135844490 isoform X2 n=1 Tax=Planococcus citri TaxID=170843 RepID=UPI0031F8789D
MMRNSSVLLMILIAYSAYSSGVMMSYENNTVLNYTPKENISITCTSTGEDTVTWIRDDIVKGKGNYTINAQTPYRKLLEIRNATVFHSGRYYCVSTNDGDNYMWIYLLPEYPAFKNTHPGKIYVTSLSHPEEGRWMNEYGDYE